MKRLPILVAVLAGALGAQAAQALELKVHGVGVSDTWGAPLVVGRKLKVLCQYYYDAGNAKVPAWEIQLQVDGQVIGTYAAAAPSAKVKYFTVEGFVTLTTAGEHQARCVLDPGGKLKGLDSHLADNAGIHIFTVDTGVLASSKQAQPGALAVNPSGAFVPRGSDTVAQGPTPVVLYPALKLGLKAQPLPNCGVGQDVVAITGTLSNVGQGLAAIPPGKPVIEVHATAGVYGANISTSTASLAPGQSVPVSANLKPKGHPASLAGATLQLKGWMVANIKESSPTGNYQVFHVTFPANFCKTPTPTTGGLRQVPK